MRDDPECVFNFKLVYEKSLFPQVKVNERPQTPTSVSSFYVTADT